MKAAVIIAAAGKGQRMGCKKQYLSIKGTPMLIRATQPFTGLPFISQIIICVPREDKGWVERELLPPFSLHPTPVIVAGGETRQETIALALQELDSEIDIVLIHDGARPDISEQLVRKVYSETGEKGAVIPGVPARDTVKVISREKRVEKTLDRERLRLIQTPQGFQKKLLIEAYKKAKEFGWEVTDDAAIMEKAGHSVFIIPGEERNIKVTTRDDLDLFFPREEARTGLGVDIHPLVLGRKLILGGVLLPGEKGCGAHSDGDVLVHALMDALLGAAGLPDIGHFFPDTEEKYRGADSIKLLGEVAVILKEQGWRLNNADCTVILEKPKIAPYIQNMKENIAKTLGVPTPRIGVKATTAEKLGFIGRGEGVLAQVVVTINRDAKEGGNSGECES